MENRHSIPLFLEWVVERASAQHSQEWGKRETRRKPTNKEQRGILIIPFQTKTYWVQACSHFIFIF